MKLDRAAVFVCCLFLYQASVPAQGRWGVEFHPSVSVPLTELGGADLMVAMGLEGTVVYRIADCAAAYAGWGWRRFGADGPLAGHAMDFEETGYVFGLRMSRPLGGCPVAALFEIGGVYTHIETEYPDGNLFHSTPHGLGWQTGVGLAVRLGEHVALTPRIGLRRMRREIDNERIVADFDLRYLSAGMGVMWSIGRG